MNYCIGLAAVSLVMFAAARLSRIPNLSGLRLYSNIFKLHYLLAGCALPFFFPKGFHAELLNVLATVLFFCLAWTGFHFGCMLEMRPSGTPDARTTVFQFAEPAIVFALAAIPGILYVTASGHATGAYSAVLAFALFCSVTLHRRPHRSFRYGNSYLYAIIDSQSPLHNLIGVTGLCLMTCFINSGMETSVFGLSITGTAGRFFLHTVAGALCAMFLGLMFRGSGSRSGMLCAMLAAAALVGGLSYMSALSPLFTGTITGAFFINATTQRRMVRDLLTTGGDHIEKVLMFSAGVLLVRELRIDDGGIGIIAATALAAAGIRMILKLVIAHVWSGRFDAFRKGVPILWASLTGQGVLAVALALEYHLSIPSISGMYALMLFTFAVTHMATLSHTVMKTGT